MPKQPYELRFDRPTDDIMLDLANLLKSLPATAENDLFKGHDDPPTFRGNLNATLEKLNNALQTDYETNIREAKTAPWSFEYWVTRNEAAPGELAALTRLYHPEKKQGSIFYGSYIRRRSAEEYLLWAEY